MEDTALSSAHQPFCEWTADSRRFALYIRPEVLGRLGVECWMAFKKVPRRGLEIGGILIGSKNVQEDLTVFRIEGFEAIDSEHRLGPSFIPSESDLARFRGQILKQGAFCLGTFRSHTRTEQMELLSPDIEMFQQCFDAESDRLFLILAPGLGKAAFYAPADHGLKRVHEFAVASSLSTILTLRHDGSWPAGDEHPSRRELRIPPPPPPFEEPARTTEPGAANGASPVLKFGSAAKAVWLLAAAIAFLALGATAGKLSDSLHRGVLPERAAAQFTPQFLNLKVEPAGSALRLSWDASVAKGAARALLHVEDGSQQSDRDLTPAEFTAGVVLYEPKSAQVAFRLDVYSLEPNATGFVQVVNYAPAALAPAAAAALSAKPLGQNLAGGALR